MKALWVLVTLAGSAAMAYGYWAWAAGASALAWAPWVAVGLGVACTGAYFVGDALRSAAAVAAATEEE